MVIALSSLAGALTSCGSSGTPAAKGSRAPFPQVAYQGGSILTAPQIVTVTFPGDPLAAELTAFGQTLEASHWWSTVTKGYCQGAGGPCIGDDTAAKSIAYKEAPLSSYTDTEAGESGPSSLQAWLASAI